MPVFHGGIRLMCAAANSATMPASGHLQNIFAGVNLTDVTQMDLCVALTLYS